MDSYQMYQQCLRQNQPQQALQHLQQYLSSHRGDAAGFYQLGLLHRNLEQWPQALRALMEACRLDPKQSSFHLDLGVTHHSMQQPEQAIRAYEQAYEQNRDPAILFNRAQALLLAGRYQEGWKEYEWRIQAPQHKAVFDWYNPERRWQGQPFPGQTLVVYHEQGFGDDIQFCRFLPYVQALGGRVVFATKKALIPILSTLTGFDQIVEHCPETYESLRFHWAVPLMSLPHFCHVTLESIPNQTPYLSVPTNYRTKWDVWLKPYLSCPQTLNIGLVYACNPENKGHVRSIPFSLWKPFFDLPDLQWFSLQKGDAARPVQEYAASHHNLVDLSPQIDDFADTAAILDRLDLLIAVDTSVPHMAGAMDKPVWMLLPYANEWRWLLRRRDCPWYPSFRLFRQPLPGRWDLLMDTVLQAVSKLTKQKRGTFHA